MYFTYERSVFMDTRRRVVFLSFPLQSFSTSRRPSTLSGISDDPVCTESTIFFSFIPPFLLFFHWWLFCFGRRSCTVVQAGLELAILLARFLLKTFWDLFILCIYVLCLRTTCMQDPWKSEKGVELVSTGVTTVIHLMDAENWTRAHRKENSVLNCWVLSPAPLLSKSALSLY